MERSPSLKPELVDSSQVSEVFCDDFVGYLIHGDVISLTFAVHRPDHGSPPDIKRVVTARLTLTSGAATRLGEVLAQWKGATPARPAQRLRASASIVQ